MKKNLITLSFVIFLSTFISSSYFLLSDSPSNIPEISFDSRVVEVADARRTIAEYSIIPEFNIDRLLRMPENEIRSKERVLLRVTGDVAPVRAADLQLRKKGVAYGFSGKGIKGLLGESDITLINLETPLIENCPSRNDGMVFCGMPEFSGEMKIAGIDIVGLANNHSQNYGQKGLEDTIKYIEDDGMDALSFYDTHIEEVKETRFGFIALNAVGARIDRSKVEGLINNLRDKVDVIVVTMHWGREYSLMPLNAPGVAPDNPVELGRWLVDVGVDLIVGHHPHVVQGIELYKEKLIVYSHGNFMFDQEWSKETKQGVVGSYVFENGLLVDAYFTPIIIEDWVRPRIADAAESQDVLDRMIQSSFEIKGL